MSALVGHVIPVVSVWLLMGLQAPVKGQIPQKGTWDMGGAWVGLDNTYVIWYALIKEGEHDYYYCY